MTAKTTFKVEVDDEVMPILLAQAVAAGVEPRRLLSIVVADVLKFASQQNVPVVSKSPAPESRSGTRH